MRICCETAETPLKHAALNALDFTRNSMLKLRAQHEAKQPHKTAID